MTQPSEIPDGELMLLTPEELSVLPTGTLLKATSRLVRSLVYIVEGWTDDSPGMYDSFEMPRLKGKYVYGYSWINNKRSTAPSMFSHERYIFERLTQEEEEDIAMYALSRLF